MPRLILLNGPPASGKSSLARRFVADHPLALNLDLDVVRSLLGGWQDDWLAAGLLARELALVMVRTHLASGHDVIIPQLIADPEYLASIEASATGATFHEVVLLAEPDVLTRRFAERADPVSAQLDGMPALAELTGRLLAVLADRPHARISRTDGSLDESYTNLLALL